MSAIIADRIAGALSSTILNRRAEHPSAVSPTDTASGAFTGLAAAVLRAMLSADANPELELSSSVLPMLVGISASSGGAVCGTDAMNAWKR
jgi:hypothetical protein